MNITDHLLFSPGEIIFLALYLIFRCRQKAPSPCLFAARAAAREKLNRLVCQLSAPDELDFTGAQNPPPNIYQPGGWAHSNEVIYYSKVMFSL